MDWPRAKSILIVSLLLLNALLAYFIYYVPGSSPFLMRLSTLDVERLEQLAAHFDVTLHTAPLPLSVRPLAAVSFEPSLMTEEYFAAEAENWLGSEAVAKNSPSDADSAIVYHSATKSLRFTKDGEVQYANAGLKGKSAVSSMDEARDIAYDFLNRHLPSEKLHSYQLTSIVPDTTSNYHLVEFNRYIGPYPIFADYYRLLVNSAGVVSFKARAIEVGKAEGPRKHVVTGDCAVLRFLAETEAERSNDKIAILDIRLGYELTDMEAEHLQPVWRIKTDQIEKPTHIYPGFLEQWESEGR